MKKIIATFFLTVYLLSATEAHQLLKLPVVFQHYAEHRSEDRSISFVQFLAMHYLHGSPKDKDYERDMQLPFKTSGDCIASIAPAFVPVMMDIPVVKPSEAPSKQNNFPQDVFLLSSYLSNIWQPPRSC